MQFVLNFGLKLEIKTLNIARGNLLLLRIVFRYDLSEKSLPFFSISFKFFDILNLLKFKVQLPLVSWFYSIPRFCINSRTMINVKDDEEKETGGEGRKSLRRNSEKRPRSLHRSIRNDRLERKSIWKRDRNKCRRASTDGLKRWPNCLMGQNESIVSFSTKSAGVSFTPGTGDREWIGSTLRAECVRAFVRSFNYKVD